MFGRNQGCCKMAADDQFWYDDDVVEDAFLADIVKIQAWVRGMIVRKQMKDIRGLYEAIVHDLDGLDMEVVWSHDHVSYPSVRKVKKIGLKVVECCMSRENCHRSANQRLVMSGSVLREAQPTAAPVSVNASPDVASTRHQMPLLTSAAVQTCDLDAAVQICDLTAGVHHTHYAGAYQCQQVSECEHLTEITAKILQVMEPKTVCSSTQTQESDISVPHTHAVLDQSSTQTKESNISVPHTHAMLDQSSTQTQESNISVPHTHAMLDQYRNQISQRTNLKQHDLVGGHLNNSNIDLFYEKFAPQNGISPAESMPFLSNCVCGTFLSDRSSGKMATETVVHPSFQNDWGTENLQSEKIPTDLEQHDQRSEMPADNTFSTEVDKLKPLKRSQVVGVTSGCVEAADLPDDKDQLLQLKNTIAMELLWVQQAISSRKHYLRLKEQLQC